MVLMAVREGVEMSAWREKAEALNALMVSIIPGDFSKWPYRGASADRHYIFQSAKPEGAVAVLWYDLCDAMGRK